MATERYFEGVAIQSDFNEDVQKLEKWKSLPSSVDESKTNHPDGFECNICLDLAQDPVVTFCGHLYCWPCIYRWITFQNVSTETQDHQQPKCPVCKTEVSQKTLIPLYGRGQATNPSNNKASHSLVPKRPPSPRCDNALPIQTTTSGYSGPVRQLHHQNYIQPSQPYYPYNYTTSPVLSIGGTSTNLIDPMLGMFGEMVYRTNFGNSEGSLYRYPNSHNLTDSSNPRVRRHIMQTDKSLSRVCLFLCCCAISCLLLF